MQRCRSGAEPRSRLKIIARVRTDGARVSHLAHRLSRSLNIKQFVSDILPSGYISEWLHRFVPLL